MGRKRRGRTEGSIFQRADGMWCAAASTGYDAAGKRRRRTVYGVTKGAVQELLRKLQNEAVTGSLESAKMTVAEYLTRWLETTRPTVQPNTYGPYERHVRLHVVPHIGRIKLAKVTPFVVEQLYAAMERAGVSATERRKVGTTLGTALRHAARVKLIPYSPAADIPKPKAAKREMLVLAPDQVARFLEEARADRLYPLYLLALDGGMRQGELFGLQWGDVDFASGAVQVQRSLEDVGGRLRLKEVKTAKGRRRIDLSSMTLDALREHRKTMVAEGLGAAPVFCDRDGGWLRKPNVTRRSFRPILARAGLPTIRFYDLRHTSATLLMLAEVNAKVVSERLGHSTVQLTLDTYSHVLPTMQKNAAEKMGEILRTLPIRDALE